MGVFTNVWFVITLAAVLCCMAALHPHKLLQPLLQLVRAPSPVLLRAHSPHSPHCMRMLHLHLHQLLARSS